MSASRDWMPHGHESLRDQARHTKHYLFDKPNRIRMGFAPSAPQGQWIDEVFLPAFEVFAEVFEEWQDPLTRTPVVVMHLNEVQAAFVTVYRKLYSGFLKNNPLVNNTDLIAMGIPIHDGSSLGSAFLSATIPVAEARSKSPAVVEIHFRNEHTLRRGKPRGIHGAEIIWAILETPPTGWDDLTHSSFDTKTPLELSFDYNQRGKSLYFALRWESNSGEKGKWSDIKNTIIP